MKLKKIPHYFLLFLLTIGASLILGFLSFGGMFTLLPLLPLAIGAFVLSVAYEGEIYFQNIKGALNKLFKNNYLQRELSKEFLLTHFPDTTTEECPQFFKDYEKQLKLFHKFTHKKLDAESKPRKKQVEKTLKDMEKWFSIRLFNESNKNATPYEHELNEWLAKQNKHVDEFKEKYRKHNMAYQGAKVFSLLAGLFMGVGSTYLLVEAFSVIPLLATIPFATLPLIIVPMAILAGSAYGMLIFNAVTNMISNDTLRKWYFKIRNDWNNGQVGHSIFIGSMAVLLGVLAITLTICTAGTWWTIAQKAHPLFSWMSKMPAFIMGVINPIIIGISSIIFNWQNTSETLDAINEATQPSDSPEKKGFFTRVFDAISQGYQHLRAEENWLQIINPFRFIIKVTTFPLRIILFIGHLISMGVGDDRVPGIPEWLAALLGTTSEIFEDAHYFFDLAGVDHHDHGHHHHHSTKELLQERLGKGHGHSHDNDLPTWFLKRILLPIYFIAAGWDYLASQFNVDSKTSLNFTQAWEKHWGISKEKTVDPKDLSPTSDAWKQEQTLYRIERFKEKHLKSSYINQDIADEKYAKLSNLQENLISKGPQDKKSLSDALRHESNNESYKKQRYAFFHNEQPTTTQDFLNTLANNIDPQRKPISL